MFCDAAHAGMAALRDLILASEVGKGITRETCGGKGREG